MSKATVLSQIKELKERNALGKGLGMFTRFEDIDRLLNEIQYKPIDNQDAIYQYIPLASVACLEGFFRFAVRTLIDKGTPFIERVPELEKSLNLKITLDIVAEIQSNALTVGELVAHVLRCNRLEDINTALTIILGKDFLETIWTHSRPDGLIDEAKQIEFIKRRSEVTSDIKRLFEIRHIFAHEIAPGYKLDKTEIIRCYDNLKSFVNQFTDLLVHSIDPDKPITTDKLIERAQHRANQADEELENLLYQNRRNTNFLTIVQPDFDLTRQATIDAWKNYRDLRAKHAATTQQKPDIQRLNYLQNYTRTTNTLIEELKKYETLY